MRCLARFLTSTAFTVTAVAGAGARGGERDVPAQDIVRTSVTYKIDLRFLRDGSKLLASSDRETTQFNHSRSDADLTNPRNLSFAQPATLDFGDRLVNVHLIGSRHDGGWDDEWIQNYLVSHNVDPSRHRLFIEQGDESASNSVQEIKARLESHPGLLTFFEELVARPYSPFRSGAGGGNPFSRMADEWSRRGGKWINVDLADNYGESALACLGRSLLPVDVAYFLLYRFEPLLTDLDLDSFRAIVSQLTADVTSDVAGTLSLHDIRFAVRRQIFDLARERYMREILYREVQDGDVLVTHPQHLRAILEPERRPGARY